MSSPIYYHPSASPYAAAIPLPSSPVYGSPYASPYASPYGSPYGPHLVALPPSPYSVPLPLTPTPNPLPLPPTPSGPVTTAALAAGTNFYPHPLLELDTEDPPIAWDVRLTPDTICVSDAKYRPLTVHDRNQSAVSPPWTFVRLRSTLLPWIVECSNPAGVTVGDVLDAVFGCLRAKVEKNEWRDASKEFQGRLVEAWERRCLLVGTNEGRAARAREEQKGIRRVDWLLWDVEWLGIERSKSELETWEMHFRSR